LNGRQFGNKHGAVGPFAVQLTTTGQQGAISCPIHLIHESAHEIPNPNDIILPAVSVCVRAPGIHSKTGAVHALDEIEGEH
jgi:hypothetical protein